MDKPRLDKVDAVIVGAGAAGSYFAARLAGAGKSVVVLEAGPPWQMRDLVSSHIWARRLKGHIGATARDGANPWGYSFNTGRGFGGAALHHFAVWPRLAPEDFHMKSEYGRGLDWPIAYGDLRPWYDHIQSEIGISGDADQEVWRGPGDPYPMPPLPTFRGGEVLRRGFDALGMKTAPAPLAINSTEYNGRPACIYDGWCEAGCPTGALANPQAIHIPEAQAAGADFRAYCRATKILTDSRERVAGVEYLNSDGEAVVQFADQVILAASATENPRLLLASASSYHPQGIGNNHGLVGRYFMSHPLAITHGIFPDETEPHMGVTGGQLTCRDGYGKVREGADSPFGSYQWMLAPATKPNDLLGMAIARADLFGRALDDFMIKAVNHYAQMPGFIEQLPDPENRITLDTAKDGQDQPAARITYSVSPATQALWEHVKAEGIRIFKAAGADESWVTPMVFAHAMGGTIMGEGPDTSVTDSYGRVHGTENLMIAGSGLFPTGGAVNPTYTIYALAARTLDHML